MHAFWFHVNSGRARFRKSKLAYAVTRDDHDDIVQNCGSNKEIRCYEVKHQLKQSMAYVTFCGFLQNNEIMNDTGNQLIYSY